MWERNGEKEGAKEGRKFGPGPVILYCGRLVEQKGYSTEDAKKKANELIGFTLDTGHLNTMKQWGWDKKKLLEMTRKMAPHTKHVHIADNIGKFGEDSHILIGRGDTPISEMMEILKENGFKGSPAFEAFTTEGGVAVPTWANVEAINSPFYQTGASPSVPEISGDMSSPYSFSHQMC